MVKHGRLKRGAKGLAASSNRGVDRLSSQSATEEAAASVEARRQAGQDGSILLEETLYWVDESGAVFRVEHSIYRANSEAAVEGLARSVTGFLPSSQKIYLVLARTLPPGGGDWLAVRPDAAFVQTPQDDADSALYSDSAELVILFPQIRSGSVTEEIGQDGALEGTLSLEADRFYSSAYRRAFQGDERERLRVAGRMLGDFFEQAEVDDLVVEETPRGLFRAKIYFSAAGVAPPPSGEQTLLARAEGWLETSLEQDFPRRGSFFQTREEVRCRANQPRRSSPAGQKDR